MEIIIAAITVGILLLWGGVLALVKMVEMFERKHIIGLGAYTSLVAGLVMGLVLFNSNEQQKQHQLTLQEQMDANSKRLSQLGERLVGQLEEKANLTQSEFEAIDRMQDTTAVLNTTRHTLKQSQEKHSQTQQSLVRERLANKQYQESINQQLDKRHQTEEQRYKNLHNTSKTQNQTVSAIQKQLISLEDETNHIKSQTAAMQNTQKSLLGKVTSNRQVQNQMGQDLITLQKQLESLNTVLTKTQKKLDDLHKWGKAEQAPESK